MVGCTFSSEVKEVIWNSRRICQGASTVQSVAAQAGLFGDRERCESGGTSFMFAFGGPDRLGARSPGGGGDGGDDDDDDDDDGVYR